MDVDEIELWEAKRKLQRQVRAIDYARCLAELNVKGLIGGGATPIQLYEVAKRNLGDLNIMWREIMGGSWQRPTRNPNKVAEQYKKDISSIIQEEKNLVHKEIYDILVRNGINPTEDIIRSGKERLQASSEVLENSCLVVIEPSPLFQRAPAEPAGGPAGRLI